MILSTKGRYGLRAMFVLAKNYGKGPTSLKQIAEVESISVNYLEQLFLPLRRNNLIKSIRGAHGGYYLSGEPASITVGQILKTLEGPILASECVNLDISDCELVDCCVTRTIWNRITASVDDVIESITLQDMLDDEMTLYEAKNKIKISEIGEEYDKTHLS